MHREQKYLIIPSLETGIDVRLDTCTWFVYSQFCNVSRFAIYFDRLRHAMTRSRSAQQPIEVRDADQGGVPSPQSVVRAMRIRTCEPKGLLRLLGSDRHQGLESIKGVGRQEEQARSRGAVSADHGEHETCKSAV
jgi:hypothetical protein